jgi:hypothetical protein
MMRALLALALYVACQPAVQAAEAGCRATEPLRIRARFAGEAPRDVLVESVSPNGFRLLDAASRTQIWSAGPEPANTQQVPGMDADFGASFAAVHLDADGLHDRLYAGDRAGRIWRLDLHAGARPAAWMRATLLAELGAHGGGRGFTAPPDVTRIDAPPGSSWLNIAMGTANTGVPRNDHRFYVLRDSLAEDRDTPLTESDLQALSPPAGVTRGNTRGYYLLLGSAQVLAQALTLNGRIHFTAVESSRNFLAACGRGTLPSTAVEMSVTVLRALDGAVEPDEDPAAGSRGNSTNPGSSSSLRRPLSAAQPASTGVELASTPADSSGRLPCLIGTEPLPACFLDTRPQRRWWRREDAD